MFNGQTPEQQHGRRCISRRRVSRFKSNAVALTKSTEVMGSGKAKSANQFQRVHDGLGLRREATEAQEFRFQHGVVKTSHVVTHKDGAFNQLGQFISDFCKRGLVADVLVVNAVDLTGVVWDTNAGFHNLFSVDRCSVLQRPNECKLDDAIVIR